MKFLILASCLVAAASAAVVNIAYTPIGLTSQYHAQDILGQYSYGYSGGPSSKQETRTFDGVTHGGYSYVDANGIIQSASYVADPVHGFRIAATNDPSPSASAGTVPVVVSGIPAAIVAAPVTGVADTPEVAAAKVAHFAAHAEAKARLTRKRRATYPQHIPVIGPSGVPQETPEVMAAKVEHAAAHARALGYAAAPVQYYGYPTTYPVLAADGQPLETSEVVAAKSAHFAAHAEARARNLVYTPSYYSGPYATPTIYNGVPLDTPEVVAAKNAHFAAYAKAAANAY